MKEIALPAENAETSICVQEMAEVDQEIADLFATGQLEGYPVNKVPELLRSDRQAVALAIDDSKHLQEHIVGHFIGHEYRHYSFFPAYLTDMALRKYIGVEFGEEQLTELNHHPYIRTYSSVDVSQWLDVRHEDMIKIADSEDIQPPFVRREDNHKIINYDRFNKDQVAQLRDAVRVLNAPEGFIRQEKFIEATKVSFLAVKEICKELGITREWYRDPSGGQSDIFFSPEQAGQIISYVRARRGKAA
jgi:hypothetical protein